MSIDKINDTYAKVHHVVKPMQRTGKVEVYHERKAEYDLPTGKEKTVEHGLLVEKDAQNVRCMYEQCTATAKRRIDFYIDAPLEDSSKQRYHWVRSTAVCKLHARERFITKITPPVHITVLDEEKTQK